MNPDQVENPEVIYNYAVDLYLKENKNLVDIKNSLIQYGVEIERASGVVN